MVIEVLKCVSEKQIHYLYEYDNFVKNDWN